MAVSTELKVIVTESRYATSSHNTYRPLYGTMSMRTAKRPQSKPLTQETEIILNYRWGNEIRTALVHNQPFARKECSCSVHRTSNVVPPIYSFKKTSADTGSQITIKTRTEMMSDESRLDCLFMKLQIHELNFPEEYQHCGWLWWGVGNLDRRGLK